MERKTRLLCAILWTATTVIRLFTAQNALVIGYHIIVALIFWGMFLAQRYCDKRGEQARKLLKRLDGIALAIAAILTLAVLLY